VEKIKFRKARANDIEFLLALRKSSMNEHLAAAGITMDDNQHLVRIHEFFDDSTIICKNERPIGLVKFSIIDSRLHIRQFQIMPAFHNMGVGGQVLNKLKQKAAERGLPITLNVLLKNPALKLYQRHGFKIENENQLEYQMKWQIN